MLRKLTLFLFLFSQMCSINAQTGGYMGNKHNLTLSANFHPVYYLANLSKKPASSTFLWIRPGYEYVLGKSFSLGVDAGFQDYEVGSNISGSALDQDLDHYFRFSGFDLKFRFRIYNYRSRGVIAPIGNHFSFLIGVPFYKTQISESVSVSNNKPTFGIEFGKQGILSDYLTIDYGMSLSISGLYISNWYKKTIDDYNYDRPDFSEERYVTDAYQVYGQSQIFGLYLKIGYLL